MRVNIYAEETTDIVEIISKEIDGHTFTGLRFYLQLPVTTGFDQSGQPVNAQGPFIHRPGDDDSSAVTFWGKRDLRKTLRKALAMLDAHYDGLTRATPECGDNPLDYEAIARVAHEANRAFCLILGDDSQPDWDDAPDWQQRSAIDGVRFHIANPDAGPSASHENWMALKKRDGWHYGPEKNPDMKLHPCMVPFDQLPPEQQAKDHLFRNVVHALAPFSF